MIKVQKLSELSPERLKDIMTRSAVDLSQVALETRHILERLTKDPLGELSREYGHLKPGFSTEDLLVSSAELDQAVEAVGKPLMAALERAACNIKKFHLSQLERPMWVTEVSPGLLAGRITKPLEIVGVYIPGGRASYPSSALMNIIPAVAAGVKQIIAVTPPSNNLKVAPEILAACRLSGATQIYKLGGAWAVGSLAHGLAGIPKVDKIVGPGSAWVMAAKMAVFGLVDIDSPAGPSEGFIIADSSADPQYLAWDFLSQLEHDPLAAAILVTDDQNLAHEVSQIVSRELNMLARSQIVTKSLNNAAILVTSNLTEAFDLANQYAPEHLEIVVADPWACLNRAVNAGSIFLGPFAPIAAGDYASGPNHVLPTGGAARAFSGLSVDAFLKKTTFQYLSREALGDLAPTVITLAEAEGLTAHAQSLKVRTDKN